MHRFHRHHGLAKDHNTQLASTKGATGFGVPPGIAAAIPTGWLVFTLSGDGDFLMNGQELATAGQCGARTILVMRNNGMFGTFLLHQEREYPQRVAGTELSNPDVATLVSSTPAAIESEEDRRQVRKLGALPPVNTAAEVTPESPRAALTTGWPAPRCGCRR